MHGHKLKTARFTSNQRSAIVAEWIDLKTDVVRENTISVSENNNQFKYLMTLTNLDKVEKNTIEHGKHMLERARTFWKQIHDQEVARDFKQSRTGDIVYDNTINFILKFDANDPEQEEKLFDLKLTIFDMEEITMDNSQTELKESIRTAKTPMELVYLLADSGLFPNMPKKTTLKKKRAPKKTKTIVDSSLDNEQI